MIHLNKLDFVGTVERLDEFLALLCYSLEWKLPNSKSPIENKNDSDYGLDIKDVSIREALQPLIQWDNLIYRVARERFIDDMHSFLAELEKNKWQRFSSVREQFVINQFKKELKC